MRNKKFILFLLFILSVFLLSSCLKKREKEEVFNDSNTGEIENNLDSLENNNEIIKKDNYKKIDEFLINGDYKIAIDTLEGRGLENLDENETMILAISYLRYGNSFYKEKENSKKALYLLDKMEETPEILYYKGYANEIVKNYDKAFEYYNKGLEVEDITDYWKSILLNQIGHVYDLKGDIDKANIYYIKSEIIESDFGLVYIQRGRVEYRKGNVKEAEKYFRKSLDKTDDKFIISEVYSYLANIYLNQEGGIEKSIEYSKKGIEEQSSYINNYINLAVAYIKKGNNEAALYNINKSIKLYPDTAYGYKTLGIYYYVNNDLDNSIKSFKKQLENSKKDITLMGLNKLNMEFSAIYDLSKSYALKGETKKSLFYLNKLLSDRKNYDYFYYFVDESTKESGAFYEIFEEKDFQDFFVETLKYYNGN